MEKGVLKFKMRKMSSGFKERRMSNEASSYLKENKLDKVNNDFINYYLIPNTYYLIPNT